MDSIVVGQLNDPELSVIIPVFNEERTVIAALERVLRAPYRKQVLIVDDGSTDQTVSLLEGYLASSAVVGLLGDQSVEMFRLAKNGGKGAAIRAAVPHIAAPLVIIQDADMEYNPADYPLMIEVLKRGESRVVYGSRYLSGDNILPFTHYRLGVMLLNLLVLLLYGVRLTDEATCYKCFESSLLKGLDLRTSGFDFCPEVTAKVLRAGCTIIEVPVSFKYRTVAEGKKIRWHDGIAAALTLLRYRFWRAPAAVSRANME